MSYRRGRVGAGAVSLVIVIVSVMTLTTTSARAVTAGQVDDFEDGLLGNWQTGPNNLNPGTNVSGGGPAGAEDNYFLLRANGGGSGGRLVAFNPGAQWAGNYLAANVNEIEMQVNSFVVTSPPPEGQETLNLHLILFDFADGIVLSTVADVLVPPGSGWQTVTFPLTASNLSATNLSGTPLPPSAVNTALANVAELDLVHSDSNPATPPPFSRQGSPPVVAQMGVDNVRAVTVPEPAMAGVAGVMMAGAGAMSRSRRAR